MSANFKRTTSLARHVTVRPGQIWADNDARSTRLVKVVEVGATHATVHTCDACGEAVPSVLRARRTRIRLDRFVPTSSGYRFISDASAGSSSGATP